MLKQKQSSSSQKPKNFPIPNFKHVLQRYDNVPEPMIHPPGSDPITFLNPNPDKICGSKPISPTDVVDPCVVVATCSEIFSKTADLTPSEHAGVTLSEHTTMISTANSDSSAHSAVFAQETVNRLDEFKPTSPVDVETLRVLVETVHEIVGNSVVEITDVVATNIESHVVVNKIDEDGVAAKAESDDVVASKVENGVVATNIESQTAGHFVGDVCNVTCNSEKAVLIHKEGKAHMKKSEKLQASSTSQDQPFLDSNGILDQESEQNLLQKEAPVDSLFFCSIPDLDCVNQKIETIATQVTVPLCTDQLRNSTLLSTVLVQPSNSLAQNINNKLSVHQPTWCELCKVSYSSEKCHEKHIIGKQHLKKLEDMKKTMSPPSTAPIVTMQSTPIYKSVEDMKVIENRIEDSDKGKPQWCEICQVSFSCARKDINVHLLGKKHLKNLQKPSLKPNSPSAVESLKLPKCEVVDPNEGNSMWCELCQVPCNSLEVLQEHISGKKHQKNLKKSETLFGLSPASSLATRPLHDPSNEESKVSLLESSKRKVIVSSASDDEDEDVNDEKRQKVSEEEGGSGVRVTCRVCKVACNGTMAFISHLSSQEHSAMALKQANI